MSTLGAQLARENPQVNGGRTLAATPLRTDLVGDSYRLLVALLAAVACLLVIAAANVSSLLLTRTVGRRPRA